MSRIILLLVTSVFFALFRIGESSGSNDTRASFNDEEDADAILENMNFAEFKERYRRLIPYMSYFVANNYVNSQVLGGAHQQQAYERDNTQPTSPLIRKPQRLVPVGGGRVSDSRNKSNGRGTTNGARSTLHKQENDFVPSVQYDPKDAGGDKDYFAPVRYNAKLNYDTMRYTGSGLTDQYREYAAIPQQQKQQQQQQQRPIIHQEVTSSAILHQDTQYYHNNGQSSRLPTYDPLYERKYLSDNMNTRVMEFNHDYPLDYGAKIPHDKVPISATDYSYTVENSEPVRYINVKPATRHHQKPTRILAQTPLRRPSSREPFSSFYPTGNNPTASLDDIMKSLQLTDRLPEMLNNNNIDSSIRTLIEILGILNNAKQNKVPRLRIPSPSIHQNLHSYDRFQSVHTRPKVVTETIFQATPSPLLVPKIEPIFRYKPEAAYETNLRPNVPLVSKYESLNNEKQENFVEYFTPLTDNIDDEKIETSYKSTERPIELDKQQEYKYQINDDPSSDLSEEQQQEKYNLPITTEIPISKFRLPNGGASANQLLVPPAALKYGATRGKPNVDYPAYSAIPETEFNCKEQRYKGFFGDPSTDCQVWHYCDLNGGKSSFLCPNGTIFSQVALTCDWWFNVKCESTTQLYVLNERLYKYILPIMPKFPEDFSGPEVDRYLELKFKEMEAKLKEKKLKKQQEKDKVKEKLQGLENEK